MARRAFAFAVLLAATSIGSPVAAQLQKDASASVQLTATRDTNVARTGDALAALRGIEQEDTILSPSVHVDWQRALGRNSGFLRGNVGYRFYEKNTQLNNESADIRGGVNVRVGRCQGQLAGHFARRERNGEDLAIPDPRIIQDTKGIELSETCGLTESLGVSAGASKIWQDGKGASINVADSESTAFTAGVVFRRSSLGELQLSGSHVETDYSSSPLIVPTQGYEVDSISARYSRRVGSRLRGSVMVSQTEVNSNSTSPLGGSSDFSGLTYALDLNYQPTSKLALTVMLDRSISPALQLTRLYSVQEGVNAGLTYQIGTRFSYALGGSRRDVKARGAILAPGPILTESTIDEVRTSLRFKQSDRLSFVLEGAHTEYDANDPILDYSATRVSLTTVVGF